jgi:hypothetical protein
MTNETMTEQQSPEPDAELRRLDRLVGTWEVSGGVRGQIAFAWLEGGFFLTQHVDLEHDGNRIRGMEVIGREKGFGAAPSEEIKSRFYSNQGETLDYVYELEGDTLTIWAGEKGSPAYCRGQFIDGGDTLSGAWIWPDGGYEFTGTRVRSNEP